MIHTFDKYTKLEHMSFIYMLIYSYCGLLRSHAARHTCFANCVVAAGVDPFPHCCGVALELQVLLNDVLQLAVEEAIVSLGMCTVLLIKLFTTFREMQAEYMSICLENLRK